jgi:hypothetical protein
VFGNAAKHALCFIKQNNTAMVKRMTGEDEEKYHILTRI